MIVYRLMCKKEFDRVCNEFPLSWNSKHKWFTDDIKFLHRVNDGNFNNSKFKADKYTHLVVYKVKNPHYLKRVSNSELMISRAQANLAIFEMIFKEAL